MQILDIFESTLAFFNTLGCTIPHPKISNHLSPSPITIFPFSNLYPMSTSAEGSVNGMTRSKSHF